MSNLKAQILAAKDLRSEPLTIPEWGVTVEVRGMSGATRAKFMEMAQAQGATGTTEEAKAKIGGVMMPLMDEFVIDGVYDPETGLPVFDQTDLPELRRKNGEIIQRIALKVLSLSGLGAKSVEDAQGNSSGTPSGDSTSS